MRSDPKTYVIVRIDQFIYLIGLALSGLFNLVFDAEFFLAFKIFFLLVLTGTIIRDWNSSWVTFSTTPEEEVAVGE